MSFPVTSQHGTASTAPSSPRAQASTPRRFDNRWVDDVDVGALERAIAAAPDLDRSPAVDALFGIAAAIVRRAIDEAFPAAADRRAIDRLIAACGDGCLAAQVAGYPAFRHARVRPVRTLVERGGKCWRPMLGALACAAVGGDAAVLYPHVLAAEELVQFGACIIDDIEDGSATRRNGPACHLLFGVPVALNAGNFCYFLLGAAIGRVAIAEATLTRLYADYLEDASAIVDDAWEVLAPEVADSAEKRLLHVFGRLMARSLR